MKRIIELLAGEAASTAGTKIVDIDTSDLISRISVHFKGTNNGNTPTAHPAKMISKIELLDGSDILFSLSGIQAQAANFYNDGFDVFNTIDYRNDVMSIAVFNLDFGRFLYDKMLALDPTKFNNLQLKITHNMAAGGSVPDAGNLGVYAEVMSREGINPIGFLMTKELKSFAMTSSAHEYSDLPVDYPYRQLIIQSLSAEKTPNEQFSKIKLSADADRMVIVNNISTSVLSKFAHNRKRMHESIFGYGAGSAVEHFITPTYDCTIVVGGVGTALTTAICQQAEGGSCDIHVDTTEEFQGIISGYCPHGALALPMGDINEINDWLNVDTFKSLKLDLLAGSSVGSSSTCEIISQQLRRYTK